MASTIASAIFAATVFSCYHNGNACRYWLKPDAPF